MPFDQKLAQRAIDWFPRYLRHTKGRWAGKPFELMPWQEDIISKLFGTVNAKGRRQYRTVYCEIPKKNGKSELAAGIALFLLFADHEAGAEIYSAAGDKDQAAIVFNVAAEMVRLNPKLGRRCKILDAVKRIVHNNGSFYRVLSAEVHTKHGFNSHGVVFDELHAQPNRDLWDVLTDGSGAARTQPVTIAITTAGYDRKSICYKMHEYARKVIAGTLKDPSFLGMIYGATEKEDWTSEKVWKKANPALGEILDIEDLRRDCKRAQEMPEQENSFRRLRLNQWTKQESRYIPMVAWTKCGGALVEAELERKPCWCGLDLASSLDIAAFLMGFPIGDEMRFLARFWVPEENIEKRAKSDKVPYDQWVKEGFIKATPGTTTDYDVIETDIIALSKIYEVREIAFDRWGAIQMSQNLTRAGFSMVEFGQGYKDMSPPTKEFLKLVLAGKLKHGDNPVLAWMADNVVVTTDPAENVKPDKAKSTERIDGVVAMIMALDRLQRNAGNVGQKFVNDKTPGRAVSGLRGKVF
jgi:phage terminase large subunit-like protein